MKDLSAAIRTRSRVLAIAASHDMARDDHEVKARFHQERAEESQRAIDKLSRAEDNPDTPEN